MNNIDKVRGFIQFINKEYTIDVDIVFNKWEHNTIFIDVGFNNVVMPIKVIYAEDDEEIDFNYLYNTVIELVNNIIINRYKK